MKCPKCGGELEMFATTKVTERIPIEENGRVRHDLVQQLDTETAGETTVQCDSCSEEFAFDLVVEEGHEIVWLDDEVEEGVPV